MFYRTHSWNLLQSWKLVYAENIANDAITFKTICITSEWFTFDLYCLKFNLNYGRIVVCNSYVPGLRRWTKKRISGFTVDVVNERTLIFLTYSKSRKQNQTNNVLNHIVTNNESSCSLSTKIHRNLSRMLRCNKGKYRYFQTVFTFDEQNWWCSVEPLTQKTVVSIFWYKRTLEMFS